MAQDIVPAEGGARCSR